MYDISLNPKYAARTVGDSIYHSLREEIIALRMKPGAPLSIKELAEQLEVSRSPVRDALMRLAGEALIDIFPQRGCRVSLIDPRRAGQEQFLREGLELLALQRFLPVAQERDYAQLERAVDRQERDIARREYSALLEHDDEFHSLYFTATGQAYSWQILRTYCVHYRRIRVLSAYYGDVAAGLLEEHRALLNAIRSRDTERSLRLEREHLHRIDEQCAALESAFPDYFIKA